MRANTNKLNFYVDEDVKKKLKKLSKESGLTMTAVITKLIMSYQIQPLKTEELLRIYKELNHIGGNINQIAHIGNSQKYVNKQQLDEVLNLLEDIESIMQKILSEIFNEDEHTFRSLERKIDMLLEKVDKNGSG